ncbi:protein kinase family protein [Nocardia sp. X0981]
MGLGEKVEQATQALVHFYRTTGGLMREGAYRIERADGGSHILWQLPDGEMWERPDRAGIRRHRPSAAEAAMAGRRLDADVEFSDEMLKDVREASSVSIRKMRSTDGELNIYKPEAGEDYEGLFHFRPYRGAQTDREVSAYRLDEALGFGRIPPTARTEGVAGADSEHTGSGMIQQFVESGPGRAAREYGKLQQQQVAVLDYVMGNLDRRPANFRTVYHGDGTFDLLAIDHGRAFPESFDPFEVPMKSDFLELWAGKGEDLQPEILAALDRVDAAQLHSALSDAGLSENATRGAVERFKHLRELRSIPQYIPHG